MGLHTLQKIVRPKKRLGRGVGSHGAKSGRGMKGQKSRAGYSRRAGFEGGQTPLYQRLPKGRGAKQIFASRVIKPVAVNTGQLETLSDGDVIGLGTFREAGLLTRRYDMVKLIGKGAVNRKLTVRVHAATPAAVKAVEQAGGKVELISASSER